MKDSAQYFREFKEKYPLKEISYLNKTWTYIEAGNRKNSPIILLHGGFVDAEMWAYQIQNLESDFRVVALNFPFPPETFRLHCDLINRIMQIENISSATICGISYGGFVCQYFAKYYPKRISRLIISHNTKPDNLFVKRMKVKSLFLHTIPNSLFEKKFKERIKGFGNSKWSAYHKYYFSSVFSQYSKKDFVKGFLTMARNIVNDPLDSSNWKGETVILSSKDDADVRMYLDDLLKAYPQAEHHEFSEGGHHTPLTYPEEYTCILKKHIFIRNNNSENL